MSWHIRVNDVVTLINYFLDKEILTMVIGQMVKSIIKAQEEKERSWKSS